MAGVRRVHQDLPLPPLRHPNTFPPVALNRNNEPSNTNTDSLLKLLIMLIIRRDRPLPTLLGGFSHGVIGLNSIENHPQHQRPFG